MPWGKRLPYGMHKYYFHYFAIIVSGFQLWQK